MNNEVHSEYSEVKVFATGIFENCPDYVLDEDYLLSLRSENHLQSNISDVRTAPLSSRQSGNMLYNHTVSVEMTVKTAKLWEPA